jgi:non-heme chloroperoxidase
MAVTIPITAREQIQIDQANSSELPPVVFIHGLWLHASSWDRWANFFRQAGYAPLTPSWPDDPESVQEARQNPMPLAGKGVGQVTDHFAAIIGRLKKPPVIIGHSVGGLITQKLLGQGLGTAAVAIDPGPFRGVLPLPVSSLKAAWPVISKLANRHRSIMLTSEQFRFAFTNAVSEAEAAELYATYAMPAPGRPLFQAATANLHGRTEASINAKNPTRGPLLLISGEKDNTVPYAITMASFKQYRKSPAITEFKEFANRGHSLVIDSGWQELAEWIIDWLRKQTLV